MVLRPFWRRSSLRFEAQRRAATFPMTRERTFTYVYECEESFSATLISYTGTAIGGWSWGTGVAARSRGYQ